MYRGFRGVALLQIGEERRRLECAANPPLRPPLGGRFGLPTGEQGKNHAGVAAARGSPAGLGTPRRVGS
jgi:hypothetical protein